MIIYRCFKFEASKVYSFLGCPLDCDMHVCTLCVHKKTGESTLKTQFILPSHIHHDTNQGLGRTCKNCSSFCKLSRILRSKYKYHNKQSNKDLQRTWMTPRNYRQATSCTEIGSLEHFIITSISNHAKLLVVQLQGNEASLIKS